MIKALALAASYFMELIGQERNHALGPVMESAGYDRRPAVFVELIQEIHTVGKPNKPLFKALESDGIINLENSGELSIGLPSGRDEIVINGGFLHVFRVGEWCYLIGNSFLKVVVDNWSICRTVAAVGYGSGNLYNQIRAVLIGNHVHFDLTELDKEVSSSLLLPYISRISSDLLGGQKSTPDQQDYGYRENCHDPLCERIARRNQIASPSPPPATWKILAFILCGVAMALGVLIASGQVVDALTKKDNYRR